MTASVLIKLCFS